MTRGNADAATPAASRRLRCAVAIAVSATLLGGTAEAVAAPPFWKALGKVRKAWKQSPEARFAVKVFRKSTSKAVSDWRKSEGWTCYWRSSFPTYCANAWVIADVDIAFHLNTRWGRQYVGRVTEGTVLSAACVYNLAGQPARILWPTPHTPSAFVSQELLRPWGTRPSTVPWC